MPPSPSPIPTLPLSTALSPHTKPFFLSALRSALLHTGFLYLSETGLPDALVRAVVAQSRAFFELSTEEKEGIEMVRGKSFLGWTRVS